MRKLSAAFTLIFLIPVYTWAEHPFSRVFLFAGYSLFDDRIPGRAITRFGQTTTFPGHAQSYNGFDVSVTGSIKSWLGIESDFGLYYNGANEIDHMSYSFLFGPEISYRKSRVIPFGHILLGLNRMQFVDAGDGGEFYANTGFAFALGGGIDYNITHRLSIRPFQADYYYLRKSYWEDLITDNNFRFSAGIVLKLGDH